jgi:hypothetical protein
MLSRSETSIQPILEQGKIWGLSIVVLLVLLYLCTVSAPVWIYYRKNTTTIKSRIEKQASSNLFSVKNRSTIRRFKRQFK